MRLVDFLFLAPIYLFGQSAVTTNYTRTNYEITGIGKAKLTVEESHTIHNSNGNDRSVFREYYDDFRKVQHIDFQLFDKLGKRVRKYNKGDALDVNFHESNQTDDIRLLIIDPKYSSYPYTVRFSYEIQIDGFVNLPEWSPQRRYNNQVNEASLEVSYRADLPILSFPLNGMPEPGVSCSEGQCTLSISFDSLDAISNERYQKPLRAIVPRLLLKTERFQLDGVTGSLSSWREFGDWFIKLNQKNGTLSESTKSDLLSITSGMDGAKDIVEKVYQYMQNRTRYVSIQLGVGGMKSLPVDFVDSKGYGDCKALTNYTQEMLQFLDIPSYQVLVEAGSEAVGVLEEFPSHQFNHVFLAVPMNGDTTWLECTSQDSPANYLGTFTDKRKVLWIEPGASRLINTPGYDADENHVREEIKIKLDAQGQVICEIARKKSGIHFSESNIYAHLDDEVIKKRNYNQFDFTDFSIESFEYQVDTDSLLLHERYRLSIGGITKSYSGRMVVDLSQFAQTNSISSSSENNYLKIRRGKSISQHIKVDLPDGFRLKYVNEDVVIRKSYGEYKCDFQEQDGTLIIHRYLRMEESEHFGEGFTDFQDFINEVAKNERSKILLISKT